MSDPNDPDGVGKGWRLLKDGEVIREGDQFEMDTSKNWYTTNEAGSHHGVTKPCSRRRRRIEVTQ